MFTSCPMTGKIGPMMASGEWRQVLIHLFDMAQLTVRGRLLDSLARDDLTKCMSDWESGRSHLMQLFEKKLAFWNLLPWKLVGLAHHDAAVAQRCGQEAVQEWDRHPDAKLHH